MTPSRPVIIVQTFIGRLQAPAEPFPTESLERLLAKAIQQEDYEGATTIRDELTRRSSTPDPH